MSFHPALGVRTLSSISIAAVAALSFFYPTLSRAEEVGYHVTDKQHLEGGTKWDYMIVDAPHRHLFIAHGDQVDVFDVDKNKMAGTIPNTHGVHGIALAADFDRGFTSNGKDNAVTVFSLSTLKLRGSVPTGKKPDGIVYDPASKRVFAANGESDSLTPIDAATGHALPPISLGGKPEFVAVDGKGRLFVNLEDKNQMAVVNTEKLMVIRRYDLSASCDEPAGLSIDIVSQRLFAGCHNQKMAIVDAVTGKVVDAPAIGKGSDATAYDPVAKLAFSSNGDGTLNVIAATDATHYQLKQTIETMPKAKTMAIDPVSHKIYLLGAEVAPLEAAAQKPGSQVQLKPGTLTLITVSP